MLIVCTGAVLGALKLYQPFQDFAGAGASVPLAGFGNLLWKGVKEAVDKAIPGTLAPSLKLTVDISAPVGTNSTRFHSPLSILGRIYEDNVVAAQPQPLPLKDSQNMGACMAPAACDTIIRNFEDFGRKPDDYNRIVTGDLGYRCEG